jgi:DNA-binding MarR family transcriptional regulator
MVSGDLLTFASVTIFAVAAMVFAVLFYKVLSKATKEYDNAREVIKEIVITFKKRQYKQKEMTERLAFDVNAAKAAVDRLADRLQLLEDKIRSLIRGVKSTSKVNKELAEHVMRVNKEVQILSETQGNLRKQITAFKEEIQQSPKLERIEGVLGREEHPPTKITETESRVLRILAEGGPMTAPSLEKKIGKTREHTARLMKKLWQEGYVERNTHRIPFIYRPTKGLKKILEKEKT